MSTVLPSTSAIPFVMSGTAVTPPVPVKVATPAPSRRIHASSVNVEAPSCGAGPNVAYALVPPSCSAMLITGATPSTTTVTVSLVENSPSLAVSVST